MKEIWAGIAILTLTVMASTTAHAQSCDDAFKDTESYLEAKKAITIEAVALESDMDALLNDMSEFAKSDPEFKPKQVARERLLQLMIRQDKLKKRLSDAVAMNTCITDPNRALKLTSATSDSVKAGQISEDRQKKFQDLKEELNVIGKKLMEAKSSK